MNLEACARAAAFVQIRAQMILSTECHEGTSEQILPNYVHRLYSSYRENI